jgi:hypothetical protein
MLWERDSVPQIWRHQRTNPLVVVSQPTLSLNSNALRLSARTGEGLGASCGAGTAPADLTVTGLAKALPYSWAEQESSIGFPQ